MFVIGDQVLTGLQDRETLGAVIEEELARQTGRRLGVAPSDSSCGPLSGRPAFFQAGVP